VPPMDGGVGLAYTRQGLMGAVPSHINTMVGMDQTHSADVGVVSVGAHGEWVLAGAEWGVNTQRLSDGPHLAVQDAANILLKRTVVADAIISSVPHCLLAVKTADCLPILVIAPPYIAVIHAGRQGTLAGISSRVARELAQRGITSPSVWMGPHICVCCYEIEPITRTHYDLLMENTRQFHAVFRDRATIMTSPYCTHCDSSVFYSYRSGDATQRNGFYLALMPESK